MNAFVNEDEDVSSNCSRFVQLSLKSCCHRDVNLSTTECGDQHLTATCHSPVQAASHAKCHQLVITSPFWRTPKASAVTSVEAAAAAAASTRSPAFLTLLWLDIGCSIVSICYFPNSNCGIGLDRIFETFRLFSRLIWMSCLFVKLIIEV